jgi:type 1 glutamine amidotransferase
VNSIAAMLAATVLGAAVPAGIHPTFPPPRDHRRPDLAIEKAHPGPVTLVAYTGDGRMLASAGRDRAVRLWHARPGDLTAGKLAQTLDGHDAPAVAMAAQGQPALMVVLGADGTVHRWEPATGKLVDQRSLGGKLLGAAIRPGATWQAAVVTASGLTLVDHQSGKTLRSFAADKPGLLAFAADGKLLAAAEGKRVQWWDAEAGTLVRAVDAPAPVRALLVVGSSVAAGHADGSVSLWPLAAEGAIQRIQTAVRPIAALGAGSKGDLLGVAGRGAVEIWDVATLQKLCTLASAGTTAAIAFNPNGQKLVTAGSDRAVRYWTVPLPPIAAEDLQRIQAALPDHASVAPKRPRKLLVFWRAEAILHKAGVPAGNKAIELLGERTGAFQADFSRDYEVFDPRILRRYDAIVLNSTAHLAIPEDKQRQALLEYVRAGGGVVGIHAAIDMFKRWPEGAEVVGATFGGHPWGPSGSWAVKLEEPGHPLLQAFSGKDFRLQDEFYELDQPYRRDDRRVLMKLDTSDAATANVTPLHRTDKDFAVSWVKRQGRGRVFYGMFGHRAEPFMNPAVLRFYLDGIQYAVGDLEVEDSPRR